MAPGSSTLGTVEHDHFQSAPIARPRPHPRWNQIHSDDFRTCIEGVTLLRLGGLSLSLSLSFASSEAGRWAGRFAEASSSIVVL